MPVAQSLSAPRCPRVGTVAVVPSKEGGSFSLQGALLLANRRAAVWEEGSRRQFCPDRLLTARERGLIAVAAAALVCLFSFAPAVLLFLRLREHGRSSAGQAKSIQSEPESGANRGRSNGRDKTNWEERGGVREMRRRMGQRLCEMELRTPRH